MRPTRITGLLLAVATLTAGTVALGDRALGAEAHPTVTVTSTTDLGSGYVQLDGLLTGATYRVPVTIVTPVDPTDCAGPAVVDVVNSVFYETFEWAGTAGDPFFPSLFPFAKISFGDELLTDEGLTYATAWWDKTVVDRQRASGTLPDPSIHIDAPTDGYQILADLSQVLRDTDLIDGGAACAATDVIGFGLSQTAMLLRGFLFDGLNRSLANGAAFDDGLVFEGTILAYAGAHCRTIIDATPVYRYDLDRCSGAPPAASGHVIVVNTESDVELLHGWQARSESETYRVYEVAGTAHIAEGVFPLKALGVRPPDQHPQNPADAAPVLRAMLVHLTGWIDSAAVPPPSAHLQGTIGRLSGPLFTAASWGGDDRDVFLPLRDTERNARGGVRLAHVRSTEPGGSVGAPLGIHRGTNCDNDPTRRNYLLHCGLAGDASIYNMTGGSHTPLAELPWGVQRCANLYPDPDSYAAAALSGTVHAADQGWIRPEEIPSLVAAAADAASTSPCANPQ